MRAVDTALFRMINGGFHAAWLDHVMVTLTYVGLGLTQCGIALALVLFGFLLDRMNLRRAGYAGLLAFALSGIVSQAAKLIWDRPRPPLSLFDVRLVDNPLFSHSFPSGHATTAFAAMAAYWAFFPKLRWLLVPLAFVVAVSRVYLGVHFPLDTAYGALIGTLLGVASSRLVRRRSS